MAKPKFAPIKGAYKKECFGQKIRLPLTSLFVASPRSDVKAGLSRFIANVACAHHALVAQHLRENVLQSSVVYPSFALVIFVCNAIKAVVADIERCAEAVAAVFRRVTVDAAQFRYVLVRAEHRTDNDFVKRIALPLQRVDEATRNLIEQTLGAGNKIRDGVGEMLHPVKRVVVDVHEVFLAPLRLFPVSNLRDSQPLCRCQLYVVHVGETVLVVANAPNLILHRCAVGMLQYERFAWHGEQAVDMAAVDDDGVVCCWQSSLC